MTIEKHRQTRFIKQLQWIFSKTSYILTAESYCFQKSIQDMRNELMALGPIDIVLRKGILIFYQAQYIEVGFAVSKSSNLLRERIEEYAEAFEEKFKDLLNESCKDPTKYESAQQLFEIYFAIFPSRIIEDGTHDIFFSKLHMKVPPELETNLLQTMGAEDIEVIKCDIQRSEDDLPAEFFELYEELKEEMDQPPPEEEEEKK